jgi:hypothetical protein
MNKRKDRLCPCRNPDTGKTARRLNQGTCLLCDQGQKEGVQHTENEKAKSVEQNEAVIIRIRWPILNLLLFLSLCLSLLFFFVSLCLHIVCTCICVIVYTRVRFVKLSLFLAA